MPAKLHEQVTKAVERVRKNGKRHPIRRNGRIIAALVSADDLKELEEMDRLDVLAAKRALALMKARGQKPIPWQRVRRKFLK